MNTFTKTYYQLVPTSTFKVQNYDTEDEAIQARYDFGVTDPESEHYQYWSDERKHCFVRKVIEIHETIQDSQPVSFKI
jgi:hypothetical protein